LDGAEKCVLAPRPVPGLKSAREIAAGTAHACAVGLDDGVVRCWGQNRFGEIGTAPADACGEPVSCPFGPTVVGGVDGAEQLALGDLHSCALRKGEVWCWGESGSLGRDSPGKLSLFAPERVLDESGRALQNIVEIAAYGGQTCARSAQDDI